MPNYNTTLQTNNSSLEEIITQLNNLPNAGNGGTDTNSIPSWEQPDSTNAYTLDDKIMHNSKTWVSIINNNVWEPGIYGWEEII
jgi:hypothetical protein